MTKRYELTSWSYTDGHPDPKMREQTSKIGIIDTTVKQGSELSSDKMISVAVFPVNGHTDEEFQMDAAKKLCDYLNTKDELIKKTLSDNALLQKLML